MDYGGPGGRRHPVKKLSEDEVQKVGLWLMDVTTEPPARELLVRFFCEAKKVRSWDKRGRAALDVAVGALYEMREMVLRSDAKNKKLIRFAVDAETTAVVLKHRLAVTEEVAQAAASGGGARLDKAVTRYRDLVAVTS